MLEFYVNKNNCCSPDAARNFSSVSAAIASLPASEEECIINIAPGTYHEKVTLSRPNTIIAGQGSAPEEVILSYDDFAFNLMEDGSKRGTFRSYSFLLDAGNVTLRNLTIENCSGDENDKGQAIALYADGDCILVENCRLLGRQDTLFTGPLPPKELQPGGFIGPKQYAPRINGRQHYRNCYICGNIDFIFGSATAYFENCTIESLSHIKKEEQNIIESGSILTPAGSSLTEGYVTAPSTPEGQKYGYVFSGCSFISSDCGPETVYLGRPWRDYAKAVFISCKFGLHIKPEGFHNWNKTAAEANSFFAVYSCIDFNGNSYAPTAAFAHSEGIDVSEYTVDIVIG